MAGSYKHCVDSNNEFRGIELIENLGDAHEALEQMYDMIQLLSGGDKTLIWFAWLEGHIRKRYPGNFAQDLRIYSFDRYWNP